MPTLCLQIDFLLENKKILNKNRKYWWCISLLCLLSISGFGQEDLDETLEQSFKFVEEWVEKDSDKAMKRMEAVLVQMQKAKYLYGEWVSQRTISDIFEHQNKMEEALEASKKGLEVAKQMNHIRFKGYSYLNLSEIYIKVERFKKAKEVGENAAAIFAELDSIHTQLKVLGNLGTIYLQLGERNKALESYQKVYVLSDSIGNKRSMINANLNIGYFYLMEGNSEMALPYVKKGLEHDLKNNQKKGIAMGYGNLAYTYSLMGNYPEAFKNYKHSVDTARKYHFKQVEYTTYKDMSETYVKSGNHKKALEYLDKHYTLKDSIIGAKTQERINDIEVKFATAEQEKENEILQQEKRFQRFQIWALGLGILLLGVIAFLGFKKMKSDVRKKEELIDKNEKIHQLEKEIIENQLTQKKLEQEKTLKELQYKNQRLTDFALDITQKNKIAETLNTELNEIENMKIPKKAQDKLRNIRSFINTNLQVNEEITTFQENVDALLLEFNQKLKQQFSELTKKDIILCGFLRLGLQNKEIATIRNVSTSAVKMARYRLRKKLNLDAENDIELFLKEI